MYSGLRNGMGTTQSIRCPVAITGHHSGHFSATHSPLFSWSQVAARVISMAPPSWKVPGSSEEPAEGGCDQREKRGRGKADQGGRQVWCKLGEHWFQSCWQPQDVLGFGDLPELIIQVNRLRISRAGRTPVGQELHF